MHRIDETEVLKFFLQQGDSVGVKAAVDRLSTNDLAALNAGLGQVIFDDAEQEMPLAGNQTVPQAAQANSAIAWSETQIKKRESKKSILLRHGDAGSRKMIVTFKFKDVFFDTGAPLLGLCVLFFVQPQSSVALAIPGIYQIGKSLLEKLQILRRPEDAEAIDTLDALLAIRSVHAATNGMEFPTTREIAEHRKLAASELAPALQRLVKIGVIECAVWGGQADDVSHEGNAWKIPV